MAGDESVVRALRRVGETADAAQLAEGVEPFLAAGQDLMPISLVPDVPDDTIVGSMEHVVERHRQLDRPQARPQVSRILGQYIYYILAQL